MSAATGFELGVEAFHLWSYQPADDVEVERHDRCTEAGRDVERAFVERANQTGGDPGVYLIRYGPDDYNAISDFREVYWDAAATSGIDGRAGAYVPMNGGRRYAVGELGNDFDVPPKPQ